MQAEALRKLARNDRQRLIGDALSTQILDDDDLFWLNLAAKTGRMSSAWIEVTLPPPPPPPLTTSTESI